MRKSKFTESQIVTTLKQVDSRDGMNADVPKRRQASLAFTLFRDALRYPD